MANKTAFNNTQQPNLGGILSWGLKITNHTELFIVTGHGDISPDYSTAYPGDPVEQTKLILDQMDELIVEAGYTRDDIIRHDWTFTDEVTEKQFDQIVDIWEEFLIDVHVKPAAGTLRYVNRLVSREMMVEYEMILAR